MSQKMENMKKKMENTRYISRRVIRLPGAAARGAGQAQDEHLRPNPEDHPGEHEGLLHLQDVRLEGRRQRLQAHQRPALR